jgi:tRNA A-37 threonylcarbamoyl transferase component Bud32
MSEPSAAETIFSEALEMEPTEWAAFLDQTCAGNDPLRREVQSLLNAYQKVGPFLERPLAETERLADLATAEAAPPGDTLSFLAPSPELGSLGRLDHYEVLEVVGKGGTGVVLRARDRKLERVVALKVLAASLATSGTARQRFAREARATAAVRDEHVIAIHAVEDRGPVPYLVMEFIDGCTLEALLRRAGPLEVRDILRIGVQAANGLAAAHKHGLVHRDVKPANVLLENGVQRVKLTDFGLARAADDASLTQSGCIAGTPLYMSPEQATGEPLDPRADLFSLGSVLYEMCTGRPAFRAPTTVAVIRRVCDETPRPIREVNPDIPEPLCRLIERLQGKRPADRPASAQQVADLLAGMLAGLQGQSPKAPPVLPVAPRRVGPSRRWLGAAAAVVLLIAGLGLSEATGVTDVRGTVIRLFSPDGTLAVDVDDPAVSVTVDGADVVITGAGVKELRLKPGQHKVEASRGGKVFRQELVTIFRNGRQVVRVSKELVPLSGAKAWEESVALLPAEQQVEAVARRLKELNPGFDGQVVSEISDGQVTKVGFHTHAVADLSPLRALPRLSSVACGGTVETQGKITDLSPLRGLPLKVLAVNDNPVSDLSPLAGMSLEVLECYRTGVEDLTPLKGMPLKVLYANRSRIADLSPLKGMRLTRLALQDTAVSDLSPLKGMSLDDLDVSYTGVSDLAPLEGMPLTVGLSFNDTTVSDLSPLKGMKLNRLDLRHTRVTDLAPLKGMPLKELFCDFQRERDAAILRSLTTLERINDKPAADFWKEVDGR